MLALLLWPCLPLLPCAWGGQCAQCADARFVDKLHGAPLALWFFGAGARAGRRCSRGCLPFLRVHTRVHTQLSLAQRSPLWRAAQLEGLHTRLEHASNAASNAASSACKRRGVNS
jgi:hypothetical protein